MGAVDEATVGIQARDGRELAGTCFTPETPPGTAVVMAPAMGVPRGFYGAFCTFLAEQGLPVLSLDYRGIGGSAPDRLRGFDARLLDWGRLDLPGAIDAALEIFDPDRLAVAAHSVGGQILGLAPNSDAVDRALAVASVKGYWRLWSGRQRAYIWSLAYLIVPTVTRVMGYLPARWIGLGGEDLPKDVASEWARWIRHPAYVVDETRTHPAESYARFEGDLLGVSLSDDWYAPAAGVQALVAMYPNASGEHREIQPREIERDTIGHFGAFRPRCRPLWEELAAWLGEEDGAPAGPGREKKGGANNTRGKTGV